MNAHLCKAGIYAGLAIALATFCPPPSKAQNNVPRYEVDPYWPKPLPNRWVTGEMGGVCADSQDHVFIVQRVSDFGGMDGHLEGLTNDELNAGQAAPPVIEFDADGNVVNSWGDPQLLPKDLHGCAIDHDGHVWLDGSEDGVVQEYSHDGRELLLQIGKRGVFDSSDSTVNGAPLNSSTTQFFRAAVRRVAAQPVTTLPQSCPIPPAIDSFPGALCKAIALGPATNRRGPTWRSTSRPTRGRRLRRRDRTAGQLCPFGFACSTTV